MIWLETFAYGLACLICFDRVAWHWLMNTRTEARRRGDTFTPEVKIAFWSVMLACGLASLFRAWGWFTP